MEKPLFFMLSERCDIAAIKRFFEKALSNTSIPLWIAIDWNGANAVGSQEGNKILQQYDCPAKVTTVIFKKPEQSK
ncbi:MAG: hypothetical protein ABJZ69_04580 [Hyphomicrobiales bacterium]